MVTPNCLTVGLMYCNVCLKILAVQKSVGFYGMRKTQIVFTFRNTTICNLVLTRKDQISE